MVVRGIRDGGIAGITEVVEGSRSFCILILLGNVVVSCNHTSQNCSVIINIMHQMIVKGQSNPSW